MFLIHKPVINNTISFIVNNPQTHLKKMKNQFIITLLCLSLIGTIATAQTQKPTTTRKSSTTVQSSAPKTTTKSSTTTTTTMPNSTNAPVVVEEKKTTTTITTMPSNSMNSNSSSNSTIIQQSSGPSKGGKKIADPKPDKVVEPKPEKVVNVKEPKPERMKNLGSASGTGFHLGVKGGVNNFFFLGGGKIFDGTFGATPQFSVGFHGGLVTNYGISETFALQLEALYVQQNVKFADGSDNLTISNSVIEIPLALQLNFGGNTKFFVNAGGYMNYGLSGSYSGSQGGVALPTVKADYAGVSFGDRSDYGTLLGVGVKFNQVLFIEARANYSVKDGTYKDSAGKQVVPIFAGLSLGYFFN